MQQIEQKKDQIKEENKILLKNFETWLEKEGLSKKTINTHVKNSDFFINEYLLYDYDDALPANEGALEINMFLGYWFIRKAMWASPSSIKENASSIKKFYTFLYSEGKIEEDDFQYLKETIKEKMPKWIATMDRYSDPDIEDVWDIDDF